MNVTTNRTVKPFLTLLVLSIASIYIIQKHVTTYREPYIINWTWTETISCHYATEGNVLPSAEQLNPPEGSIFFHETSCRGGLSSREACAVETAARLHPERSVYVFFNSPVSEVVLTRSCLATLTQFKNVKLARLHAAEYARGTALHDMLARKENDLSKWQVELTSDMLRYISMYKHGGVYLDTDVLAVKPLGALGSDWVAREDDEMVNVAVLAIGKKGVGHDLVSNVLNDLKADYRPDQWVHNGPGAMTRTLLKFCNATRVSDLNASICHGFNVYDPSLIYPVHWTNAREYFELGELPAESAKAFTHHLWNKMTREMPLEEGAPYDNLTRQYCPTVREMYGDRFGS